MKFYKIISLLESISDKLGHLEYHLFFKPKDEDNKSELLATYVANSSPELHRVFHDIADNEVLPIQLGEYFIVKIYKRNF